MKNINIAFMLFSIAAICYAELTPEQVEEFTKHVEECKEKNKVNDEDISNFMQHKLPESESAKCFAACVMKKVGILGQDNSIARPRVEELLELVKEKDAAKYDAMLKIFNTCEAEVPGEENECAVAEKLLQCCTREMKKANIQVNIMDIYS